MVAAVAPNVDSGISKTVNLRAEAGFADVGRVFIEAWRLELKSIAVFRPLHGRDSVLSLEASAAESAPDRPGGVDEAAPRCPRCGEPGYTRIDGCAFCPACGLEGPCD
jgi:ribonucleotide reductase alpha subunit